MKYAQDFIPNEDGQCLGGFNSRLFGESFRECTDGSIGWHFNQRAAGWNLADGMIKSGKIFSKTNIDGREIIFKCFRDGDAFCCVGEGFENLQESNNYAFGASFDEAIKAFSSIAIPQNHDYTT